MRSRSNTRADLIDTLNYMQWIDSCGRRFSRVQAAGTATVAEQVRERIKAWGLVGLRLNLMARMAHHHEDVLVRRASASLTKAMQLIEDQTDRNHSHVEAAWKAHKGVAHIAAAVVHVSYEIRCMIDSQPSNLRHLPNWSELKLALDSRPARILQVARSFQSFVLTFKTPQSPKLIDTELWLIPGPALVDLELTLPKLDASWVERLRNLGSRNTFCPPASAAVRRQPLHPSTK